MDKQFLRKGCTELIRELCALVDRGKSMDRSQFHDLCEQERFIDFLFTEYTGSIRIEYLNKTSSLCKSEVLSYFNEAMSRHANVVLMEDFGLKDNALLMAINVVLSVMREAEE